MVKKGVNSWGRGAIIYESFYTSIILYKSKLMLRGHNALKLPFWRQGISKLDNSNALFAIFKQIWLSSLNLSIYYKNSLHFMENEFDKTFHVENIQRMRIRPIWK